MTWELGRLALWGFQEGRTDDSEKQNDAPPPGRS
jgi:hypothetical protein